MEQHPVPRNISSFEFHLIGDMTLRQFGYLAGGALIGYLTYRLSPFPQIINIPLGAAFGLVGTAFAFFPIQERPLDRWFVAFIRSIFSPTQYLWQKDETVPDILSQPSIIRIQVTTPVYTSLHHEAKSKLASYLATIPSQPHENLNSAEKRYLEQTLALFGPQPHRLDTLPHTVVSNRPHTIPAQETQTPKRIVQPVLETQLPPTVFPKIKQVITHASSPNILPPHISASAGPIPAPTIPVPQPQQVNPPHAAQTQQTGVSPAPAIKPENQQKREYEEKWNKLAKEKDSLESELKRLHEELAKLKQPEVVKPTPQQMQKEPTIQTITQSSAAKTIGVANYPQYPNMIVGMVKDMQKKFLPNIIVTVKDKAGTPLRALKTNKLGQFATATQLPDGVYRLELEDPMKRYVFDIAEITLTNTIFPPLEIIAKGERELIREKLTKELFGNIHM